MPDDVEIVSADDAILVNEARALFLEYANTLDFDLSLQDFDRELAELPGAYQPTSGCLLLARVEGQLAGCAAMRKIDDDIVEMKRLYVRLAFRGKGLDKRLAVEVLRRARDAGYKRVRLDTLPTMAEAAVLYRSLGFQPIAPYHDYPVEGVLFLELTLRWSDAR